MIFYYWLNTNKWHSSLLFVVKAAGIMEADALFETELGTHPAKLKHVSCAPRYLDA